MTIYQLMKLLSNLFKDSAIGSDSNINKLKSIK